MRTPWPQLDGGMPVFCVCLLVMTYLAGAAAECVGGELGRDCALEHEKRKGRVQATAQHVQREEGQEAHVVVRAHAAVQPHAVVVHARDAEATVPAVLQEATGMGRSQWDRLWPLHDFSSIV